MTSCVLTEMKSSARKGRSAAIIRFNIEKYCRVLLETMFGIPDRDGLRQFVADKLRKMAEEIELHNQADTKLAEVLATTQETLARKSLTVEAILLKEESEFYTRYGKVMPASLRDSIKADAWDSLDNEYTAHCAEKAGQGNDGAESATG